VIKTSAPAVEFMLVNIAKLRFARIADVFVMNVVSGFVTNMSLAADYVKSNFVKPAPKLVKSAVGQYAVDISFDVPSVRKKSVPGVKLPVPTVKRKFAIPI
jgi:hypothetical protein